MGCATATIKYLVFFFNALCALLGIGVIVVNSIGLKDVEAESRPILIFFIVIGSIIFLISFFGCCGAIKESVCLTWLYSIIMMILLVLTCVLIFVYLKPINERNLAETQITEAFKNQVNSTNTNSTTMAMWQTNLECCGITGPSNYKKANRVIPPSCYPKDNTTIPYTDGCLEKLTELYQKTFKFVRIFGYILIAVEACAFLFATILAISFNNEQRRSRY